MSTHFGNVRSIWMVSYRDQDEQVVLTASVHDPEVVNRLKALAAEMNLKVEVHKAP